MTDRQTRGQKDSNVSRLYRKALSETVWAVCPAGQAPGSPEGVQEALPAWWTGSPSLPVIDTRAVTLWDRGPRTPSPDERGTGFQDLLLQGRSHAIPPSIPVLQHV